MSEGEEYYKQYKRWRGARGMGAIEVGMESCGNEKMTFELRFKVVRQYNFWISGVITVGREEKVENMYNIMKEQQNQMRMKWSEQRGE